MVKSTHLLDLKTRLFKRGHGSDYSWELLPPLRGGWAKTHFNETPICPNYHCLLKMEANQATLIDRWDRKEEPLIAFAAASFRSIYKGLDGTVLLSVFLRGKRGLLSNSGCSFLRVGAHSFFEMV